VNLTASEYMDLIKTNAEVWYVGNYDCQRSFALQCICHPHKQLILCPVIDL
jgi:hypothetical protein